MLQDRRILSHSCTLGFVHFQSSRPTYSMACLCYLSSRLTDFITILCSRASDPTDFPISLNFRAFPGPKTYVVYYPFRVLWGFKAYLLSYIRQFTGLHAHNFFYIIEFRGFQTYVFHHVLWSQSCRPLNFITCCTPHLCTLRLPDLRIWLYVCAPRLSDLCMSLQVYARRFPDLCFVSACV